MAFLPTSTTLAFESADHIQAIAANPDLVRQDLGRYQALAGLQLLDVATTWVILANWSVRAEGNPIVAGLINHTGLVAAMMALLVVKLAVVRVLYEKQTGVKLMSAIYGLVVANNLLFLGLWLLG